MGLTEENKLLFDFPLEDIHTRQFKWYWVDFENPEEEEASLLHSFFEFHPLTIEDCLTVFNDRNWIIMMTMRSLYCMP